MNLVSFPGLGLELSINRIAFTVFGLPIYWYGVIIAVGFLAAVMYCMKRAPAFGVVPDHLTDLLLFAVPLSIVGARLYYIVFYLDLFRDSDGRLDFMQMLRSRDGGLAIYGAVIAAILVALVFTRVRKLSFFAYADLGVLGLLIGQIFGRWGNFFNIEAYGGPTTLPWRMGVYEWTAGGTFLYQEVHPTFLYESLWNLAGLFLLIFLSKKGRRKFDGMLFLTYLLWYGMGRAWIEGLRTDSLYFFGLTLLGAPVRVSQLLALLSAAAAAAFLIWKLRKHPTPDQLYVSRLNAAADTQAGEAEPPRPAEQTGPDEKEETDGSD